MLTRPMVMFTTYALCALINNWFQGAIQASFGHLV